MREKRAMSLFGLESIHNHRESFSLLGVAESFVAGHRTIILIVMDIHIVKECLNNSILQISPSPFMEGGAGGRGQLIRLSLMTKIYPFSFGMGNG